MPVRQPGRWREYLKVMEFISVLGTSFRVAPPMLAKKKASARPSSATSASTGSGDEDHSGGGGGGKSDRSGGDNTSGSGSGTRRKRRRKLTTSGNNKVGPDDDSGGGGGSGSASSKKKAKARPGSAHSDGSNEDSSGGGDDDTSGSGGGGGASKKKGGGGINGAGLPGMEMELREESTEDHITLDRPWLLEDVYNIEVHRLLPHIFYYQPLFYLSRQLVQTYPVQKAAAVAAITLHKYAAFLEWLLTNFDEESDTFASLQRGATQSRADRDKWLVLSRTIVQMSFDFTLRRQVFGALYRVFGATAAFVKLVRSAVKTAGGTSKETPYEFWKRSLEKVDVVCILDKGNDHSTVLGEFKLDLKAPADIMREFILRTFRTQLNATIGESFLFFKVDPDTLVEDVLKRDIEFKTYSRDFCFEKTDAKTMVTSMTILITPDPTRGRVVIPEFVEVEDDEEKVNKELEQLL